jgi:integrase
METYPRNWRQMGLVISKVNRRKQRRPYFTKDAMNPLANSLAVERKMRMSFILCGATGLRLGEALGIRVEKILSSSIKRHGAAKYTTTLRLRTGTRS